MAGKNTLARYLEKRGRSAIRDLRALVKSRTRQSLRWATIYDIARGAVVPRATTAQLLHKATDGEIDAAELLGLTGNRAA